MDVIVSTQIEKEGRRVVRNNFSYGEAPPRDSNPLINLTNNKFNICIARVPYGNAHARITIIQIQNYR